MRAARTVQLPATDEKRQAEQPHLSDRLEAAKQAKAKLVEARRSKRQGAGEGTRKEEATKRPSEERKAKGPQPPEKLREYHNTLRSNSFSAQVDMHARAMQVEAQRKQREMRARQAAE